MVKISCLLTLSHLYGLCVCICLFFYLENAENRMNCETETTLSSSLVVIEISYVIKHCFMFYTTLILFYSDLRIHFSGIMIFFYRETGHNFPATSQNSSYHTPTFVIISLQKYHTHSSSSSKNPQSLLLLILQTLFSHRSLESSNQKIPPYLQISRYSDDAAGAAVTMMTMAMLNVPVLLTFSHKT